MEGPDSRMSNLALVKRIGEHVWRLAVVLLVLGGTTYASYRHGTPKQLPTAALEWRLLFHLERAVVLLTAVGAVLLVGWRAMFGELPIKFGQLEYQAKAAAASSKTTGDAHEKRIGLIEGLLGIGEPPPPAG